jgi:hypothetical protein
MDMINNKSQKIFKIIFVVLVVYFLIFFIAYEKSYFEMNASGESGNIVWIREFRSWIPFLLRGPLDYIYSPLINNGFGAS